MKTKNNFKKVERRVEKTYTFSVVDVVLNVEQSCERRGIYTHLVSKYRIAYTDDNTLTGFVNQIKKDPILYYKRHFRFNEPILSTVTVNPVCSDSYIIHKVSTCRAYYVVNNTTDLHIYDMVKQNQNLIQYQFKPYKP